MRLANTSKSPNNSQAGMGFAYSGNIGDQYAVFEPTHDSAPKYAGLDKVNPIATILAAKMMVEWLGETRIASNGHASLRNAVEPVEIAERCREELNSPHYKP